MKNIKKWGYKGMNKKNFALIGASGYIAPRHVKAIKDNGGDLLALLDPHDSVGYIDQFFPNASYFKETERLDRHLDRLKRKNTPVDYVSVCSPNYLHDAHIRLSLRNGCNVICEKPLVLKNEHIDALEVLEKETNKKIYTILQLRYHPTILQLKNQIQQNPDKTYEIDLNYITPRGKWYDFSWKSDFGKSGGVVTNIGIHFFDMLLWIFGEVKDFEVKNSSRSSKGTLILKKAKVNYYLSLDEKDLPWTEWKPYRSIKINNQELEFGSGFTDLHIKSYEEILNGNGFRLEDVRPVIKLVEKLKV